MILAALLSSIQLLVLVPALIALGRLEYEIGGFELYLIESVDWSHEVMTLLCVLPSLALATLVLVIVGLSLLGTGAMTVVAAQAIVATMSSCSRGRYSSRSSPSESPLPRVSSRIAASPCAAKYACAIWSVGRDRSRRR